MRTERKVDCGRRAIRAWDGAGCVRGTVHGVCVGRCTNRGQSGMDFALRGKPRHGGVRGDLLTTGASRN